MRSRSPVAALAASPTMVGAVTTLIVIVAVFLAYNANNGLPFVPVYRVSVEVPNASRLGNNNEIRIGGTRVGVVEAIEPIVDESQSSTAQAGGGDTGVTPVAARLDLKLDKTAEPLPQDSVFRVRYRSAFGLKYLEIVRGTGPDAPEGFVFDGTDDGISCRLPVDPDAFSETIPEQSRNGCFQPQTEFDAISNTFDTKTREAARENLIGYGNAFAARGMSLNDAIQGLRPLFEDLGPVARVLANPKTQLRRFISSLARTARIVAPVSQQQANFFANAAIAFRAISSDEEALKSTISEGPPTLETAIDTLPRQRVFLAEFAELSRRLRPGVQQLRLALPSLNSAVRVGTPVLRRTPPMNRDLREVLVELKRLVYQPTTKVSLQRLSDTFGAAKPLLRWVVPAQTVCNYFNYWFTFLPEALSDSDQVGYNFRQALTSSPPGANTINLGGVLVPVPGEVQGPVAGYSGIQANGKTGAASPTPGMFEPLDLPILHGNPYSPSGQHDADCQAGQTGYFLGDLRRPGQSISNPVVAVSDIPGSRGPTTLYWTNDNGRQIRDTRVEARQP